MRSATNIASEGGREAEGRRQRQRRRRREIQKELTCPPITLKPSGSWDVVGTLAARHRPASTSSLMRPSIVSLSLCDSLSLSLSLSLYVASGGLPACLRESFCCWTGLRPPLPPAELPAALAGPCSSCVAPSYAAVRLRQCAQCPSSRLPVPTPRRVLVLVRSRVYTTCLPGGVSTNAASVGFLHVSSSQQSRRPGGHGRCPPRRAWPGVAAPAAPGGSECGSAAREHAAAER